MQLGYSDIHITTLFSSQTPPETYEANIELRHADQMASPP